MAYGIDTAYSGPNVFTGTAAAVTGTISVKNWRMVSFVLSGLSTETVTLDISLDNGATWSTGVRPIDLSTGALAAASALGNGSYSFGGANLPCSAIRLTKSATANTVTASLGFRS